MTSSNSFRVTLLGTGGNGIRDLAGNRLPTTTIRFTTAPDLRAPAVTTTTPADGATAVAPAANQVVNFSERVIGVTTDSVVLHANGAAQSRFRVTKTSAPRSQTTEAASTGTVARSAQSRAGPGRCPSVGEPRLTRRSG